MEWVRCMMYDVRYFAYDAIAMRVMTSQKPMCGNDPKQ